ncbi:unnamed protein product, partial [Prorocentrum cordatum]
VVNSAAALALQEANASEAEPNREIHSARKTAACFVSVPNRGTGGVAVLTPGLSPTETADPERRRHSEPAPGRVQRLQQKSDVTGVGEGALRNMIAIYNIHNFQLAADQAQRTRGSIRAELSTAEQQPERVTVLVMGDFNFMDEAPLEMTAPLVEPKLPTHYAEHSQQCTRVDKIYISSPPWLLSQWCAKVDIPMAPGALFRIGISDHAPVHLRPLFAEYFDLMNGAADVDNYPPFIRLKEFKRLIREAARLARNDLADARAPCSAAALTACRAISRAVWRNDWKSARALRASTELGAKFLDISDSNHIALIEPETCRRTFEQHQKEYLDPRAEAMQQEEQARDTPYLKRQRLRKMPRATEKRGKLWAPTGKVLKLRAIE